jgi:hypothetical protein
MVPLAVMDAHFAVITRAIWLGRQLEQGAHLVCAARGLAKGDAPPSGGAARGILKESGPSARGTRAHENFKKC